MQVFPRADIFLFSSGSTFWIAQCIHSFCCFVQVYCLLPILGNSEYICYELLFVDFLYYSPCIFKHYWIYSSFLFLSLPSLILLNFSSFPALILLEIYKIYQFLWMTNFEHPLYTSTFYFILLFLIFTFLDILWNQFPIFPSFLRKEF